MSEVQTGTVKTKVPARLDRLPWSRWHWMVIIGLGTVWILDGLEVTIARPDLRPDQHAGQRHSHHPEPDHRVRCGHVCGQPIQRPVLRLAHRPLRPQETVHDHPGRYPAFDRAHRLLLRALVVLPVPVPDRFGIGGEYAAINSAIDELIPSRHRGRYSTIIINGTFWAGAAVGALISVPGHQRPAGFLGLAGVLRAGRGAGPGRPAGPAERWTAVLFFASAGASAAYLTVSEVFPMEYPGRWPSRSSTPSARPRAGSAARCCSPRWSARAR